MNDNERVSRLKRLKALADRGVGGEKENAGVLFKKLCDKYHISPEQIGSPEEKTRRWFKHKRGGRYQKLLSQCMFKILGSGRVKYTRGKTSELGVDCNSAEAIEIELDYNFYSSAFEVEIDRLYDMFIQKNNIFPLDPEPESETKTSGKEFTEEDILLYRSIKKQNRTLQIED